MGKKKNSCLLVVNHGLQTVIFFLGNIPNNGAMTISLGCDRSYAFLIIEEEHRFFSGTLFRTLFRNLIVVVFLLAIVR